MGPILWPHGWYSLWNYPGQNTGVGSLSLLHGDLPNPGIKPGSPALQVDSFSTKPQGMPKNTGVGSLSLLQQIFLTQELNWGLLHCRWILYQLSYQGFREVTFFLTHFSSHDMHASFMFNDILVSKYHQCMGCRSLKRIPSTLFFFPVLYLTQRKLNVRGVAYTFEGSSVSLL